MQEPENSQNNSYIDSTLTTMLAVYQVREEMEWITKISHQYPK